jgi:hypothetical protein
MEFFSNSHEASAIKNGKTGKLGFSPNDYINNNNAYT